MKRHKVPANATTQVKLENISQVREGRHRRPQIIFHFYEMSGMGKSIGMEVVVWLELG